MKKEKEMKKKKKEAASLSHSSSSSSSKTQQKKKDSPSLSEQRVEMVGWSDLPVELLEKIAGNLDDEIADRIKFGAVCKRWRSALLKSSHILPRARLPWLLLAPEFGESEALTFCSLSYLKTTYRINHNLNAKVGLMRCICCSDSGWLLMVDSFKRGFLVNPITGSRIFLPELPAFASEIRRCSIIISPKHNQSLTVLMDSKNDNWLIWCYRIILKSVKENKPLPSSSWTSISIRELLPYGVTRPIGYDLRRLWECTYHRGLYFIMGAVDGGSTAIVDPGDMSKVVSVIPPPLAVDLDLISSGSPALSPYFVQSSEGDELFLVVDRFEHYSKKRFEVFRWDSTGQQNRWSEVRSIKRNAFFIARCGIIALPADNSSTFTRENRIVYVDGVGTGRLASFDIGDESVERFPCVLDPKSGHWTSYWFLPVQ